MSVSVIRLQRGENEEKKKHLSNYPSVSATQPPRTVIR